MSEYFVQPWIKKIKIKIKNIHSSLLKDWCAGTHERGRPSPSPRFHLNFNDNRHVIRITAYFHDKHRSELYCSKKFHSLQQHIMPCSHDVNVLVVFSIISLDWPCALRVSVGNLKQDTLGKCQPVCTAAILKKKERNPLSRPTNFKLYQMSLQLGANNGAVLWTVPSKSVWVLKSTSLNCVSFENTWLCFCEEPLPNTPLLLYINIQYKKLVDVVLKRARSFIPLFSPSADFTTSGVKSTRIQPEEWD